MVLDMYEMCTESLQKKCLPIRDRFKKEDDYAVEKADKVL